MHVYVKMVNVTLPPKRERETEETPWECIENIDSKTQHSENMVMDLIINHFKIMLPQECLWTSSI